MDKTMQFAKTKDDLVEKIKTIVGNMEIPENVRNSFVGWLAWFEAANIDLPEIQEESLFYRAFTIPNENFFAVQIWEKHPDTSQNLVRCIKTWYANKPNIQNWADEIIDKRRLA